MSNINHHLTEPPEPTIDNSINVEYIELGKMNIIYDKALQNMVNPVRIHGAQWGNPNFN